MLRVGLTGGIGSGKSTAAGRLAEHGAVLIDADRIAREVVAPGSDGLAALVDRFGEEILDDEGALDRPAMASRVFGDEQARAALNAIVHPRIGSRTAELMAEAPGDAIVVHDVPLLVENDLAPGYQLVVVVDAPEEVRVRRLVERGLEESDARSRIRSQATEAQRREVADVWLDNAGSRPDLLAEVDALWARAIEFEANLRAGRPASCGGPARVVDPDPEWPREAARLIARIRAVAGGHVLRIDHIGSTSVPGLAAKDVIDLQVTVPSPEAADALAEPLAGIGFPRLPHIDQDNPKSTGGDVQQRFKRCHVSADPGRPVSLHVRVEGRANWRYALLVRDWLRANPGVRAEYEDLKREVALRHAADADREGYGEAKEPWFDQALPRAEEWARRSGWRP